MDKKRTLYLFYGWLCAVGVAVLVAVFIYNAKEVDTFGAVFGSAILLLLAYRSYSSFKMSKIVSPEEKVYEEAGGTSSVKTPDLRKAFIVVMIVIVLFEIILVMDLNKLESGEVEQVSTWGPLVLLYKTGGYWPTVLAMPVFMVIIAYVYFKKLHNKHTEE